MKITIENKKRRVSFWKYIAFENLKRLERLEKKVDELKQCSNKRTDKTADDGNNRTD